MRDLNQEVLGSRLRQVREVLELSQKEIANKLNCKQSSVSNLELGKGGSITLLLKLLNFYSSSSFYIDLLFSEDFYLVEMNKNMTSSKAMREEIINRSLEDYELKQKAALSELSENLKRAAALVP